MTSPRPHWQRKRAPKPIPAPCPHHLAVCAARQLDPRTPVHKLPGDALDAIVTLRVAELTDYTPGQRARAAVALRAALALPSERYRTIARISELLEADRALRAQPRRPKPRHAIRKKLAANQEWSTEHADTTDE